MLMVVDNCNPLREAAAAYLQDRYLSALASLLKGLGKSFFDGVCHSRRTKKNRTKKTEILRHLDMKHVGEKTVITNIREG
jgi:hypothetical protein